MVFATLFTFGLIEIIVIGSMMIALQPARHLFIAFATFSIIELVIATWWGVSGQSPTYSLMTLVVLVVLNALSAAIARWRQMHEENWRQR